jgi:hypothetical protein
VQSRLGSLIETITNIVIGFIISMSINAWILPAMGYHVTLTQNFIITVTFTVVSIIRSYALRRVFNVISMKYRF